MYEENIVKEYNKKNKRFFLYIVVLLLVSGITAVILLNPFHIGKKNKTNEQNEPEIAMNEYIYFDTNFGYDTEGKDFNLAIAFKKSTNTKITYYLRGRLAVDDGHSIIFFDTTPIKISPSSDTIVPSMYSYKTESVLNVEGKYYLLKNYDDSYSIFYQIKKEQETKNGKPYSTLYGTIIGKYIDDNFKNHFTEEEALNVIKYVKENFLLLEYTNNLKTAKNSKEKEYDLTESTKLQNHLKDVLQENYNISTKKVDSILNYELHNNSDNIKARVYFTVIDNNREYYYGLTEMEKEKEGDVLTSFTANDTQIDIFKDETFELWYKYNNKIIIIEDQNSLSEEYTKNRFIQFFTIKKD